MELPLELPTELAITAEVPQVMGESFDPGTLAPNLPPSVLQAQQGWGVGSLVAPQWYLMSQYVGEGW